MMPDTPDISGRVVGAGPVTLAAGYRLSDDHIGSDGAVRGLRLPSMPPMGPLLQPVGCLATGISTVQPRDTQNPSAEWPHSLVVDRAMASACRTSH